MSAFDGLTFKQGLTKVGVPADQAEAISALIRDHVVGNAATKDDLLHLEAQLNEKIDRVEERLKFEIKQLDHRLTAELTQLNQSMTIKLGSLIALGVAIVVAAQQLFK